MARRRTRRPTSCCSISAGNPVHRGARLVRHRAREAFVVAIVIPVTILLTLFAAWLMGYTLNRVSLFALIFSMASSSTMPSSSSRTSPATGAWLTGAERVPGRHRCRGRSRQPDHRRHADVVAALLPMLFVSGMMGPYMSPIPANAGAMIISFFIRRDGDTLADVRSSGLPPMQPQIMITPPAGRLAGPMPPWRGRSSHRGGAPGCSDPGRHRDAGLAGAVLHQHVTVKLLPFDDKPELAVQIDCRGHVGRGYGSRLAGHRPALREVPEIASIQSHAGSAAPFNFNGLVRHSYLRAEPQMGDLQVNLKTEIRAQARQPCHCHRPAPAHHGVIPAGRRAHQGDRATTGAAVLSTLLAEIYGPDPDTRARSRQAAHAFRRDPFIVDIDDSFGTPVSKRRIAIADDQLEFFKVEQRDVFETIRLFLWRPDRRLFASRRRTSADPDPARSGKVADGARRARAGDPGPANLLPGGSQHGRAWRCHARHQQRRRHSRSSRRNGRPAEMVTGRTGRQFRGSALRMLAVQRAIDAADWGDLPKPSSGSTVSRMSPTGRSCCGRASGRSPGDVPRHGGRLRCALLAIYILVVAQFGSFKVRW